MNYTYAIHEAYYDKNGHVGAITKDPVEPFGENIEELRHSWVMMAEAFGQPILDYDNIPEPGYERKEDPIGSELDERLKEFKRVPLKDYARPSLDKHRLGELAAQAGVQDAEKFVEETGL